MHGVVQTKHAVRRECYHAGGAGLVAANEYAHECLRRQVAELEDQLLEARRSAPPIATQPRVDDFEVEPRVLRRSGHHALHCLLELLREP